MIMPSKCKRCRHPKYRNVEGEEWSEPVKVDTRRDGSIYRGMVKKLVKCAKCDRQRTIRKLTGREDLPKPPVATTKTVLGSSLCSLSQSHT